MSSIIHGPSFLTEQDIWLFKQGSHFRLYEKLGAHRIKHEAGEAVLFAVWAPNAAAVSVVGDFNGWNPHSHPLAVRWDGSGIWEGAVTEIISHKSEGRSLRAGQKDGLERYKFHIRTLGGQELDKADPLAFFAETPPGTASRFYRARYEWQDGEWMEKRRGFAAHRAPVAIYELHAGSWRRKDGRMMSWRELADELIPYIRKTGFTHVELLPVMEHPFYGSWGYQTLGYFAPTGRYGTPEDLMCLVDRLHQAGIGIILDWTPAHFPEDAHGLARFDGTCLYEHEDPRKGRHPDWHSAIFNYGRREVRSFLFSSAFFWLDRYHADGLRADAVASMLYLDYSRKPGEWIPNRHGGNENTEAVDFLRDLNTAVYAGFPGAQTFAEESTAWPGVSRPVHSGGLGFGFKWNMGWMHDTLEYMSHESVHRKYHHDRLTFPAVYAFAENFVLPLSHDEVVHGKRSLLEKMPGDDWQKFANLRLLLGLQYAGPGKKLLFMGGEFGQRAEWNHETELDWPALRLPPHAGVARLVCDLNRLHRTEPALYERDVEPEGFRWVDWRDAEASVVSFLRFGAEDTVLVAANFTPVPRAGYRIGVPRAGAWREILNTDAEPYGGSGVGNLGRVVAEPVAMHGLAQSLTLALPPLALLILKPGIAGTQVETA